MGRKEAVSGVVICLAVALLQVVWQPKKREMDVISSVSMNNGDQIREYIVVLLNGFSGYSEEEIQKEILKSTMRTHLIAFVLTKGGVNRTGYRWMCMKIRRAIRTGRKYLILSIRKSRKLHEVIAICLNICYVIL